MNTDLMLAAGGAAGGVAAAYLFDRPLPMWAAIGAGGSLLGVYLMSRMRKSETSLPNQQGDAYYAAAGTALASAGVAYYYGQPLTIAAVAGGVALAADMVALKFL